MPTSTASNAPSARRRARAGNAATDANADDAQNDIVAVEFAPDGGRERAWTAVHRVQDLRPKRARGGFVKRFGAKAIARFVKRAFLPAGFPGTVSPDYLAFQSWDTAQGLCSYVRGALTTRALLEGVGVGADAVAAVSAASATAQFVLRDVVGSLGAVLFAAARGSSFDAHAKQWRLFADCANDVGMALELLAPTLGARYGRGAFLATACAGSLARAVCGVAAGATRAALTRHFARAHNAADVAAKEASQETATSVFGSAAGVLVARVTAESPSSQWFVFLALTAAHVLCNVRAVRCLRVDAVNRARARKMVDAWARGEPVPTPREMASREALFAESFADDAIVLGASFSSLDENARERVLKTLSSSRAGKTKSLENGFLVCPASRTPGREGSSIESSRRRFLTAVLLRRGSAPNDALRGYFTAAAATHFSTHVFDIDAFMAQVVDQGWDVNARVALNPAGWRLEWGDDIRETRAS